MSDSQDSRSDACSAYGWTNSRKPRLCLCADICQWHFSGICYGGVDTHRKEGDLPAGPVRTAWVMDHRSPRTFCCLFAENNLRHLSTAGSHCSASHTPHIYTQTLMSTQFRIISSVVEKDESPIYTANYYHIIVILYYYVLLTQCCFVNKCMMNLPEQSND